MAQPYVSLTFEDEKGKKSSRAVYIPTGLTLAQYTTFANALYLAVGQLITGELVGMSITFPIVDEGDVLGAVGSDLQEMARFAFNTAAGFISSITIPTFLESLFYPNSADVDLTDTDVDTFLTLIVDGDGTVAPVDLRGSGITATISGREAWGN